MNTNETATIYLNNGNQLLESGNLEEAIAAYRNAIELNPDLSWSHHNLGEALAKLGKLEEAIAAFRRAIELNPDFSWSYHHLGDVLERQQQWEESVAVFHQAIELNPEHFGSYVGLGNSLEKLGQLDEAIAAYRRGSELNPKADWIQYRLGEVLQQRTQLDLEGAIVSYRRAIELNPDDVQAYRKLLQIDPDNLEVLLLLGKALIKQEQWDEAIAAYRHITELNPDDVQAHYRLGELLIKQGDLEGAINTLRHSLELTPDSDESYYNLGEALSAQGNATEAGLCYYKAFTLNPNNIQAHQKRPKIYDCFAFFNELDVLRIRIEELKDVVDKFILVEATKTFSGNPKPLYYQEFSHEFAEYQDKIIHYVVDDMPEVLNGDRWPLDIHQKDCIIRPLRLIECDDEDIILISDVDEIPRKEKIRDAINLLSDNDFVIFTHDMYHNNLDNFKSQWWCGTVACKYKDFKVRTTNQVRRSDEGYWTPNWKSGDIRKEGFQHPYIEKGGWHLSYFGGAKTRRYKVQSFAHAEGDNSQEKGIPLINFDVARPTNDEESMGKYYYEVRDVEAKDIPDYLKNNIRQYRHFLKPKLTQMALAHADLHLNLASHIYQKQLDIAVNLWRCAMQLNPETGKKKSFLSELSPVDYFQISPQQLFNRSGQLIKNEKGYQLVSFSEHDQIVSFGPYISVPDGVYRVKIDVEMDAVDVKETNNHKIVGFKFDMLTDIGNTLLWEENVYINEPKVEFYIELRDANKLEVRFFSTGQRFAINSIELALLYPLEVDKSSSGNFQEKIGIQLYSENVIKTYHTLLTVNSDTVYRIQPEQLLIKHGHVISSEKGKQIYSPQGNQGLVAFGPYIPVSDGFYRVTIDMEYPQEITLHEGEEKFNAPALEIDVVTNEGRICWHRHSAYTYEEKIVFFIDILNSQDLEVRFWAKHTAFKVNCIEIFLMYTPDNFQKANIYYSNLSQKFQSENKQKLAIIAQGRMVYERIWTHLNQPSPDEINYFDYPEKIDLEEVTEYFNLTSRYKYKLIDLPALNLEENRKYLERLGLLLSNVEKMTQSDFDLETEYISNFSDSPKDRLNQRINLTHPSYQQSLVETGYIYTVCPFSGQILRSNQSFVINHCDGAGKGLGHWLQGFIYRFVATNGNVFYLMTGFCMGERLMLYFPNWELSINLRPTIVQVNPVQSINRLKSYLVSYWQQVKSYIKTEHKTVADVVGLGFNMGHHLWQDLGGIQALLTNGIIQKINKFLVGSGDYFNIKAVFPEIPADKIMEVADVKQVFETVIANNYVALRVNGDCIEEELIRRVFQTALNQCSQDTLINVEQAKQHFPILGIHIRVGSRNWLGMVEGIANIINKLHSNYPNLGLVFSGWSLTGKEDIQSGCWSVIKKEQAKMEEIKALISPKINTYSVIGSTIEETIVWVKIVDSHISPIGSGLTFLSWIANKPGVVHGPREIYGRAEPLYGSSIYRENLQPQIFLSQESVTDREDDSYDCDWQAIHNELVKILTQLD
ncbi:tetratricopeptide repeat protein [Microcoleus sp. Z1_C3]|uniref:tetratricopeptide repeat protein n=1 Tax=unclassified Microcoleus TaxID=2642155 RepID=UPI002FD26234